MSPSGKAIITISSTTPQITWVHCSQRSRYSGMYTQNQAPTSAPHIECMPPRIKMTKMPMPSSTPNSLGSAPALVWIQMAPAAPAIAEPSVNMTMPSRWVGMPLVSATVSLSRAAIAWRFSGERSMRTPINSTAVNSTNHSQKKR